MRTVTINPCAELKGQIDIPGDKSISHRALMFASIAQGTSTIDNLLEGHDCLATLQVMRSLGVHIELDKNRWLIHGQGRSGLIEPDSILDCKNSGTTIRLMAGLLSAMPFMTILNGTEQIKLRPMDRVIEPLSRMGARVYGRKDNKLAPLVTLKSTLSGINYQLLSKSAQVKSALILAGLFAEGKTRISNTKATRDHSERLLSFMGADIESGEDFVEVSPLLGELKPIALKVPGDISSAAFMLAGAALRAKNAVTLKKVGVNPTRTGIIDALRIMGAQITFSNEHMVANEPVADISICMSDLRGARFNGDHIVRMIDEIPILALLATQAQGTTIIEDAGELRVKESNRIQKTVECLQRFGAAIEETHDGMLIRGPTKLHATSLPSFGDHRLALLISIAALIADGPTTIVHAEVTDDSYPGFLDSLVQLGVSQPTVIDEY